MVSVAQAWLDSQCGTLNGVAGAMVLLLTSNGRSLMPAAVWPSDQSDPGLAAAAKTAFEQQRSSVSKLNGSNDDESMSILSHPLSSQGRPVGAVALAIRSTEAQGARTTLEHLAQSAQTFSAATEAGQITAVVQRYALAYPERVSLSISPVQYK